MVILVNIKKSLRNGYYGRLKFFNGNSVDNATAASQ